MRNYKRTKTYFHMVLTRELLNDLIEKYEKNGCSNAVINNYLPAIIGNLVNAYKKNKII